MTHPDTGWRHGLWRPPFAVFGVLLLAVVANSSLAATRDKPNVILIMTDDQGYGDLACHGNPAIRTPSLDDLCARSVRLTDFHVTPACATTRAAVMTGRNSRRTGVWHVVMGRCQLDRAEVTMADVFQASGYRTAIFGKWHLGDAYPFRPQDHGFEEVWVHGGGVVGHTPDWWLNDYFDDTYLHNGQWQKVEGYATDVWFDKAMEFIEKNEDRPFFVYLPTNAPHQPFLVPPEYEAMYEGKEGVPNAAFYGMITYIDANVGRMERHLRRLGLDRDTILIFMTDNGTSAGLRWVKGGGTVGFNAGMRGKKSSPYDGGHRVPCWFHWPGGSLEGGRDVDRITAHVDLLPTLIDLCDLDVSQEIHFDGTSLVPLLQDGTARWPDRTLVTELQLAVDKPVRWERCAVMTDRWRLVNGQELYDIKGDPGQRNDLAAEHPQVVARLRDHYDRWWESVAESHDRIPEIVLGSEQQNPTLLTAYHWNNESGQQRDMPWGQYHVVAGPLQNGFWWVRVEQPGTYRFRLRRWPEESHLAINRTSDVEPPEKPFHPLEPGALTTTRARLAIQDVDAVEPIEEGAEAVVFTVPLKAGSTTLRTWFLDEQGNGRGAYYVSAERLPAAGS